MKQRRTVDENELIADVVSEAFYGRQTDGLEARFLRTLRRFGFPDPESVVVKLLEDTTPAFLWAVDLTLTYTQALDHPREIPSECQPRKSSVQAPGWAVG